MHQTAPRWTISQCVELACILEATAPKAGNVHPGASFEDMTFEDLVASAVAIAPVFEEASTHGVGTTVLAAVERRRGVTPVNTNLGMILLLAPLAAVPRAVALDRSIGHVLKKLTVADAHAVYRAIRLAGAGGLGHVDEQDISEAPTCTLRQAMQLAADRDLVAHQYVNGFADVLAVALPGLCQALECGLDLRTAIVRTHLVLLARFEDTLILRKCGEAQAREATRRAREVLDAGFPAPNARSRFDDFDAWLREGGHSRNPGASADLLTAALFAGLRDGIIDVKATIDG